MGNWGFTGLIPNDLRLLPFKAETRVSFPLGWLEIVRVIGSAFSVVSNI